MRGLFAVGTLLVAALCAAPALALTYVLPRDAAFDQRVQAEIEARDPEGAALFAQATAARDRGDEETSRDRLEQVHARDPWFVHATRRLCGFESSRGDHERAVALCREAYQKDPSAADGSALALALLAADQNSGRYVHEASERAREAAHKEPGDFYTQYALCQAALAVHDTATFHDAAGALRRIAPHDALALYFAAIDDAGRDELDVARRELEEAHRNGLPDGAYDRLAAAIDDARSPLDRYGRPALVALVSWLAVFGLLLGIGALLSVATLRASQRVPTESTGHPRGSEALLRRTYRAVLWMTCAYYYLSLPLVALALVVFGGGVVYLCLASGHVPIKLLLIVLAIVLTSLWAIAKSVFVRGRDADPGDRLALEEHPALRRVLDEVAARIGTRPVDSVYLTPGTEIAVLERGGLLRQLRGRSERCLVLGAAVLDGMRVRELKAILSHEYGHFHNEDTAGGGFALAVRRSLMTMAIHLMRGGAASNLNPAWWFVKGFHAVFLRVSQGASRLQEVLADRWAAFAYGSEAFVRGLKHVVERAVRFDAHIAATLDEVVPSKQPLANVYAFVPKQAVDAMKLDQAVEQAMNRPASPYDSHPSPADRVAWVTRIAAAGAPDGEEDARDAWSLLPNREAIEKRMTDEVRARLAMQGFRVPAGG
jgi:Zn-dependent protease with chaperone function